MRKIISLNKDWNFQIREQKVEHINLPHSWNGKDGQDGGNDYLRDVATYSKRFFIKINPDKECVFLCFNAVNAIADVYLNEKRIAHHEGGYSRFIVEITSDLKEENELVVKVDNRPNASIYPYAADFTFYGGIYRDVSIIVTSKKHFES